MEDPARQIQSYVDAYSETVSWADSRFYIGSRRAGDAKEHRVWMYQLLYVDGGGSD